MIVWDSFSLVANRISHISAQRNIVEQRNHSAASPIFDQLTDFYAVNPRFGTGIENTDNALQINFNFK
jgi:hypothetical protein